MAVTNYHQFTGLKQHKCIHSQFYSSEAWAQSFRAKIKCQQFTAWKSLPPLRKYIHRFWGLGPRYLWGLLLCLTPTVVDCFDQHGRPLLINPQPMFPIPPSLTPLPMVNTATRTHKLPHTSEAAPFSHLPPRITLYQIPPSSCPRCQLKSQLLLCEAFPNLQWEVLSVAWNPCGTWVPHSALYWSSMCKLFSLEPCVIQLCSPYSPHLRTLDQWVLTQHRVHQWMNTSQDPGKASSAPQPWDTLIFPEPLEPKL